MQIEYEGTSYSFDFDEVDVLQAKAIKASTRMTLAEWEAALKVADPDAIQALWWLILVQNGHNPKSDPASVNVKLTKMAKAFKAAAEAEGEGAEQENPTSLSPRSRRSNTKTS
jgi:hypothetical protein